jgi:CSLREA domain-containing protein
VPRLSRFLVSASLALGTAVVCSSAAVAAERAPGPLHPVTVTATVPSTATVDRPFTIDLAVDGPIAGLQAQVMLDQKAAEVGGVIPIAPKGKALNPVMNHGGARIGAYGAASFTEGRFLRVAVFPRKAGRLTIHLGRVEAVTASGRRVQIRLPHSGYSVQIGKGKRVFRAATVTAALPGRIARGPIQADSDRNGIVTRQDLYNTTYGWNAGNGSGDIDHNGRVDVADLQTVLSLVKPEPRVIRTAATLPLTFVVNTNTDAVDATPGDKICLSAAGFCTLRAALDEANRHSGPDTVTFSIPGPAPQIIQLTLGKLIINQAGTTIDGYTQPGAQVNTDPVNDNAVPGVELRGNGDAAKESIFITNAGTTIRGLAFTRMWKNIWMSTGATGTTVSGNFIGMTGLGASLGYSGQAGVLMDGGAHDNIIGLPTLEGRNVVGNVTEGIDLYSPGTDRNIVRNNLVGISPSGSQVYTIRDNGFDANFGPKSNVVGGFGPLERNVISGATNDGVEFSHGWNQALAPRADTSLPWQINDNQVLGNYIGFTPSGVYSNAMANGHCFPGCETNDNGQGINIIDGANRTIVDGNYVDGLRSGVTVSAEVSTGNVIRNNFIGIAPNGGAGQINRYGVYLTWHTDGNTVSNNKIANTGWAGIGLDQSSVYDNLLTMNTMKNVGYPGIDMLPMKQVNINGTQPLGADHAVFYPVITAATTTSVTGTAMKNAIVEVFRTTNDPGLYGPGESFLGSTVADAAGAWSLNVTLPPGAIVTSTATTYANINTSEFGQNVAVGGAPPDVHGATYSSWEGFSGTTMGSIPIGTPATSSSRLSSMKSPTDRGDNNGTRLQALLTAPATGSYTFWIASDDNGRLMLSNSADPAGRALIARVDSWTAPDAFDTFATQQSAPVNLVAGQQYYIEAFSKEGTGGDNLSVAWSGPSIGRQVIPGDVLTPTTAGCTGWCPNAAVAPTNALLQSFAGKCLDVNGASTTPGAAVIQYDCSGQTNQRWTLTAGGAMQVYGNRCLSPAGGVIAAGTSVVIDNCTGSAAQTWTYTTANGRLTVGGLCLEVVGASTANLAPTRITTCNGQAQQTWAWAS